MFDKLFGEGKEQQFKKLKVMVPISSVLILGAVIYILISSDYSGLFLLLGIGFVWGIRYVPKFVFHKSIGNFFENNIFTGLFAMAGMLILSCVFGIVIMIIGYLRFIYLLINRSISRRNQNNPPTQNLNYANESNGAELTFKDVNYRKPATDEYCCMVCEYQHCGICKIVKAEIPDAACICNEFTYNAALSNLLNTEKELYNQKHTL